MQACIPKQSNGMCNYNIRCSAYAINEFGTDSIPLLAICLVSIGLVLSSEPVLIWLVFSFFDFNLRYRVALKIRPQMYEARRNLAVALRQIGKVRPLNLQLYFSINPLQIAESVSVFDDLVDSNPKEVKYASSGVNTVIYFDNLCMWLIEKGLIEMESGM
jgi:hypothetical protein